MLWRNLLFPVLLGLLAPGPAQAQLIARLSPLGVVVNTFTGPGTFNVYAINFEGEYFLSENLSTSLGIGLGFPDPPGRTNVYIRPEATYYLGVAGDEPAGVYTGGFIEYGNIAASFHHFGIGAQGGYQMLFLDDRLAVDGFVQLGYGRFFRGGGFGGSFGGLLLYPGASVGWTLDI